MLTAAHAVPYTPVNTQDADYNDIACFTAFVTALLIMKQSMLHSSHDSIAQPTAQLASQQP